MPNMSYCRFENTARDLRDCMDNLDDGDLSKNEAKARTRLIELCKEIAESVSDDELKEMKAEGIHTTGDKT